MGELIPFYLQEVVPGDKFKVSTEQLIRLAPMLAPIMHRVNVYQHFFFVPNRLVFAKWGDYITGGADGSLEPTLPMMKISETTKAAWYPGLLGDYFGINPVPVNSVQIQKPININALPFRAYSLIWNEYFRDQTLTPAITINTGETVSDQETLELTSLRQRYWEKDYFTSALPWAQRGDEVLIPSIPVTRAGTYPPTEVLYADGTATPGQPYGQSYNLGTNQPGKIGTLNDPNNSTDVAHLVLGDSSTTTASGSINDLRKAARLQEWLEKNARGGARYIEQILAHFGVRSSDARLQRPEFLGGAVNPVVISEVLSTAETAELPQGNMSGHGIAVGHNAGFTKFFEEHGYIIGLLSVLPRTSYQQGIPRHFLKSDRFDYFFPEFAQIGEQPVLSAELYTNWGNLDVTKIFGYQSRYAEYKFNPNTVHGDFRGNLNYWHMGRIFLSEPALNDAFVASDPSHRIFAVTDDTIDKLQIQILNKVTAIRPMPVFGTPQL